LFFKLLNLKFSVFSLKDLIFIITMLSISIYCPALQAVYRFFVLSAGYALLTCGYENLTFQVL